MPSRCFIISGGEFCPIEGIAPGDFVIACDRGYEYARRCGVTPDLVVGDFDSYQGGLESGIPVDRYVSEKDDTDTMIAVRYAVDHHFTELVLCCALGARLDHTLANIQAAVFAAAHGLRASLYDQRTVLCAMTPGLVRVPRREGWSLSLFAVTDECTGVSIRGAKYPLQNARLTNSFPIGVSNEWRAEEAEIELGSGMLLIVMSRL